MTSLRYYYEDIVLKTINMGTKYMYWGILLAPKGLLWGLGLQANAGFAWGNSTALLSLSLLR